MNAFFVLPAHYGKPNLNLVWDKVKSGVLGELCVPQERALHLPFDARMFCGRPLAFIACGQDVLRDFVLRSRMHAP
jgi:hypothetical protein